MKFLMFNVVVIGALAYLAVGPGGADFFKTDTAVPVPVVSKEDIAAKAKELYEQVYAERMNEAVQVLEYSRPAGAATAGAGAVQADDGDAKPRIDEGGGAGA